MMWLKPELTVRLKVIDSVNGVGGGSSGGGGGVVGVKVSDSSPPHSLCPISSHPLLLRPENNQPGV